MLSNPVLVVIQVPVDHMFRYVLRVQERDGGDRYDISLSRSTYIFDYFNPDTVNQSNQKTISGA